MLREWFYVLRLLGKTPGFTAITTFVFAAGFGLAVYMYVLIKMFAYGDLPYPDDDRIVAIDSVINGVEAEGGRIFYYDYEYIAERQRSFDIFFPSEADDMILSQDGIGSRVFGQRIGEQMFALTQVSPMLGNVFTADDLRPEAPPVAVISHRMWLRDFDGDPAAVGRSVQLNGVPTTIIGVMPEGFRFPLIADVWIPFRDPGAVEPGDQPTVQVYARLKDGVSRSDANTELSGYADELAREHPETNTGYGIKVWPFTQIVMANSMSMIGVMIVATGFILLLVCANATNLLLARAGERQKELAIRAALGAPRGRLIRQIMLESMTLAVAGGLIGLFCAAWAMEWSRDSIRSLGEDIPFWWDFSMTWGTVIFAAVLVLGVGALTGLLPALRASGGDIVSFLRDGTRGALGRKLMRFSKAMVIIEIMLCATLLICSGMLVRSMYLAVNADYGANVEGILIGNVTLHGDRHAGSAASIARFADQVQNQLSSVATGEGDAATVASALPGMSAGRRLPILTESMDPGQKQLPRSNVIGVLPGYFSKFGVTLREGREFTAADDADGQYVAIINEAFARQHWPDGGALGKRVRVDPTKDDSPWLTVVGISSQIVHGPPFEDFRRVPAIYVPMAQRSFPTFIAVLKSPQARPDDLITAVARIDGDVPVWGIETLSGQLSRNASGMRFISELFVAFAILALLLAGSGIFAITSRSVVLRTQEIGVRRALGADSRDIFRMLLAESGRQLAIGGGLGLLFGLGLVLMLSKVLFNFNTEAPFIFTGVGVILTGIVGLATWVPARRAVSIPPNRALHYE